MLSVKAVEDNKFNVTKRSPQIQKSSKCGSIDEPRSGLESLFSDKMFLNIINLTSIQDDKLPQFQNYLINSYNKNFHQN